MGRASRVRTHLCMPYLHLPVACKIPLCNIHFRNRQKNMSTAESETHNPIFFSKSLPITQKYLIQISNFIDEIEVWRIQNKAVLQEWSSTNGVNYGIVVAILLRNLVKTLTELPCRMRGLGSSVRGRSCKKRR